MKSIKVILKTWIINLVKIIQLKRMSEDTIENEVKLMSDRELSRWATLGQFGFKQVAAEQELIRRKSKRDFWTKDIAIWITLGLTAYTTFSQLAK